MLHFLTRLVIKLLENLIFPLNNGKKSQDFCIYLTYDKIGI